MTHTLVAENKKKKGKFEKMFLDGRPPVALGVTSGGDFFGGTQISFTDVLGDQQFNMFAASVSQYRTMSLSYMNLERRLPVGGAGLLADAVLLRALEGALLRPGVQRSHRSRSRGRDADAPRRHGVRHLPVQPLPPRRVLRRARRTTTSSSTTRASRTLSDEYQQEQFGQHAVQQRHHDAARRHVHPGDDGLPRVRAARRQHDARQLRERAEDRRARCRARPSMSTPASISASVAADCSRCARRASTAGARIPSFMYFGGNSEMRGYDYLSFVGQDAFFLNAELRFPLIEAMATPIGILGGIRGTFFANMGGASWDDQAVQGLDQRHVDRNADHRHARSSGEPGHRPGLRTAARDQRLPSASTRARPTASACRPSRSASPSTSTGRGRRSSTRTGKTSSSPWQGGSDEFRKPKFTMWIGYDF